MFDSLLVSTIISILITILAMFLVDDFAEYKVYKEYGHVNKRCSYLKYIWIRLKL